MVYASGIVKHWKSNRQSILEGCDPEIRAVIADLNDNRLYTVDSCSGHKESKDPWYDKKGRIHIASRFVKDEKKVVQILRKHGLKNIHEMSRTHPDIRAYEFNAVGMGKSQTYYRTQGKVG
jgi:hypothetical protein